MNFLYKKSPFLLKKWGKMSFPDHDVNRKDVDNDENCLSMQFQPKLMTRSRVNGQKPHFLKNCLQKKSKSFRRKSGFVTFLHLEQANLLQKIRKK